MSLSEIIDRNTAQRHKTRYLENCSKAKGAFQQSHLAGVLALTHRECEVLQQIALGLVNKEIAFALKISSKTVEKHRMFGGWKIGCANKSEVTRWALSIGLIKHHDIPSEDKAVFRERFKDLLPAVVDK